ncbi:uncharacterized protein LOC132279938 [Cornus florida]|uniref:uncharacterized protein LOC132279938 n=1 Tax=Cornus florida TaxID=4283 RepID=UPI00289EFD13|nr:uncharacterized protein LOC132279938 [Cornus florida]
MDSHEKQKKGVRYVYRFGTGDLKPESDTKAAKKKSVWGLRRWKTSGENEHNNGAAKGIENGGNVVIETRKSSVSSSMEGRKSVSQVETNVASVAAFLQVKVLVTDMPGLMQVHAFRCARRTYDSLEKFSPKHMAYNIKKEFDKVYGPAWHCIVGSSFGSFVTHSTGCFLYFSMEKLYILVFKTKIQRALE